jgi:hypothetical protein
MPAIPHVLFTTLFHDSALRKSYIDYLEEVLKGITNDLCAAKTWEETIKHQGAKAAISSLVLSFQNHHEEYLRQSAKP